VNSTCDPSALRDPLRILHFFRAPVGGLFRHVLDLARGQIARGQSVGLVADASTGGEQAEASLARLAPDLALGLTRVAMSRQIGAFDIAETRDPAAQARSAPGDRATGPLHPAASFRLSAETLRGALLWLTGFSGAFVFIEPSPYELVAIIAGLLFLAMGLSMRPALAPLVLLLVPTKLVTNASYGWLRSGRTAKETTFRERSCPRTFERNTGGNSGNATRQSSFDLQARPSTRRRGSSMSGPLR